MEATKPTNESVKGTPKPSFISLSSHAIRQFPRKWPIVATVEKSREARHSRSKKSFRYEYIQEKKAYSVLAPFPWGIKKAIALLEQWDKDFVIFLPHVD